MENLSHKSDLNSYCQRTSIPLPVYKTTFKGHCHALRFACTVSVGGKSFTSSPSTFTNRKSAEQDAAKLALQHLTNQEKALTTNLYLRKLVCQDKARVKMILNEFLDKIKMECGYETVQVEKTHVFVSSLTLNGSCYKGECGKNKKEAEQLAALAAILSLLDDPTYATLLSEVIKSKFSVSAVFNVLKEFPNTRHGSGTSSEFKATTSNSDAMHFTQEDLLIGKSSFRVLVDEKKPTLVDLHANSIEEQGGSRILVSENKQVLVNSQPQIENQVNKTSLPQTEKQGGQGVLNDTQSVAGHLPGAVTISRCSYVALPRTSPLVSEPQHVIKLPLPSQQIGIPTEFAPVQAAAHNPVNNSICFKKRRKKKTNKRLPRTSPLISEPQHGIKLPLPSQQIGIPTEFAPVQAAAHNPLNNSICSKKRRKKKTNKRLPRTSPLISEPQHGINLPKATHLFVQKIGVPTEFVPVPAAYSPCNDSIRSKKRRKKNRNYKANKRLRAVNKLTGCTDIHSQC